MSAEDFVLALAGAPASGKTTVAQAVAQRTGGRFVSFGDLIRAEAADHGQALERGVLQRLGQQLLDDLGPEELCHRALRCAGATLMDLPVVWDGVRHLRVLTALRSLYDVPVRLVFLEPPDGPRRERFAQEAASQQMLECWEADATEQEALRLADAADLRCTALSAHEAIGQTLALLSVST